MAIRKSLAKVHSIKAIDVHLCLGFSLAMLFVGYFLPLVTTKKFVFFRETYSIFSGLKKLLLNGDLRSIFLFALFFLFSVVFPIGKLSILILSWLSSWHPARIHKYLKILGPLCRWSLIEPIVLAFTILLLTQSLFLEIDVHVGFFIYAGSIILTIIAAHRMEHIAAQTVRQADSR